VRCAILSIWGSSNFSTNPFMVTVQMVAFGHGMSCYSSTVLMGLTVFQCIAYHITWRKYYKNRFWHIVAKFENASLRSSSTSFSNFFLQYAVGGQSGLEWIPLGRRKKGSQSQMDEQNLWCSCRETAGRWTVEGREDWQLVIGTCKWY
jgi:hypothetical protein